MGTDRKNEPAIVTAVAEGLERDGARQWIQATATVLRWDWQTLEPNFAALQPEVVRKLPFSVPFYDALIERLAREANDLIAQGLLLVA